MRHRPTYRIVVTESRRSRDGEYIESLGHYDPRTKLLKLDNARAEYWLSKGAQATGTADKLIKRSAREGQATAEGGIDAAAIASHVATDSPALPETAEAAAEKDDELQAPGEMAIAESAGIADEPEGPAPETGSDTPTETADEGDEGERAD